MLPEMRLYDAVTPLEIYYRYSLSTTSPYFGKISEGNQAR